MGTARRTAPLAVAAVAVAAALAAVIPALTAPAAADPTPVNVLSTDFEDGTTQNWTIRGTDEAVANSTTVAHGGSHSLAVTGRAQSWEGPQLDLLDAMQVGTRYTLSVWVRLADGESTTPLGLSVERRVGDTASYDNVVRNVNVSPSGWTELTGSYTLASTVDFLTVYVESQSGTASFFIDDFSMSYVPASPIQTDIPGVQDALSTYFPYVGAAVDPATLLGEHGDLLDKHFNSVTPGNQMKWDATEPTEGNFKFTDADTIVDYARAHGIAVRGHTLAWYNQTPAWVFQDADGNAMTATPENKALLLSRLHNHIDAVVGHFKGEIYAWDVVNEALNDDGSMRNSSWYQIAGLDYIIDAFTWAHEDDPAAELCINDYNLTQQAKRDAMYNLVSQLRAQGVPVDCIGSQMHSNINYPSGADTGAMLDKFASLGVDQQITELDVSVYTDNSSSYDTISDSLLTQQAARYKALFDQFKSHASEISSVTFWGLADDNTWLDSFPINRLDAPLLFDQQLQAKPAYWAVIGSASGSPLPSTSPSRSVSPSPSTSPSRSTSPSPSVSPSRSVSPSASPSRSTSPSTSPSASPSRSTPAGGCTVAYAVVNQWPGGFQGDVKVTNNGTGSANNWTLTWSFTAGQQVTQLWNGTVAQAGTTVTVSAPSWAPNLGAGQTAEVGFLGNWTGSNPPAVSFTLNGTTCTTA